MRLLSLLVVGACQAMILCPPVLAQDATSTRTEVSDLVALYTKPLGVRNLGMGWVGVADGTVAENVYFNPANLVSHGGLEISAATQNWGDEYDFFDIGGAARFRIRVGEDTAIYLTPGIWYAEQDYTQTTVVAENGTRRTQSTDRYVNFALAAGFHMKRFEVGLGAAVKPTRVEFAVYDEKKTAWAFDVGAKVGGLLFDKNGYNLTGHLGGSFLNVGSDAEGDLVVSELPTEARLGLAFLFQTRPIDTRVQRNIPGVRLYLNGEIIDRSLQDEIDTGSGSKGRPLGSAVGTELCLINTFNIRVGYMDDGVGGGVSSMTWGIGIQFGNEKFRFALDLSHLSELYRDGPSVTSTGAGMSWYY